MLIYHTAEYILQYRSASWLLLLVIFGIKIKSAFTVHPSVSIFTIYSAPTYLRYNSVHTLA